MLNWVAMVAASLERSNCLAEQLPYNDSVQHIKNAARKAPTILKLNSKLSKLDLHCNRNITSKRVMSGEVRATHSSGEPFATVSHLIGPKIKPKTSRADSDVFDQYGNRQVIANRKRST